MFEYVTTLYTLGPSGTNCEAAAYEWFRRQGKQGKVVLCPTLESAVKVMLPQQSLLLACIVYPDLHHLVFRNLRCLKLVDCFVMPTYEMVLASKNGEIPHSVSTHPAPVSLLADSQMKTFFVNSNAQAAAQCAEGVTDGCITTMVAARRYGLEIMKNFGPVPMGFSLHASIPT